MTAPTAIGPTHPARHPQRFRPVAARLCALLLACAGAPALGAAAPNFVVVVIDDAGLTDLGAYGSEIRTPHIDALAATGVRFANFHAAPTCAPSRAMLMTGVDSHLTGHATLNHLTPPEHRGAPGYEGELSAAVTTLAEHLRAAGYATFATGKWHLGHSPQSLPEARGFDRSFVLDASGADNWEQRPYLPLYRQADWFEGGARGTLPADFYSSQFIVDQMLDYLTAVDPGQPFLAYLGFQAIHIPVQAPREFVDRYDGVYDAGWSALRKARHAAAIENGLIPANAVLGPVPDGLRDWDSLSDAERRLATRSMQVNAGMLEAMDHHLGRLVEHLKATGTFDNTVFVVLSDNGPEYNAPTVSPVFNLWLRLEGYSRDPERLGERGTYAFIGPEWASATAAPGSLFKFHAAEGGTRVPLIFSGPGIAPRGIVHPFAFITDITPTLLELAGAEPLEDGLSFTGRPLDAVLDGRADAVYGPDEPVGLEASGQSALFKGDYKLVRNHAPFGDQQWRLHDIVRDPGETRDLAGVEPERYRQMLADYQAYAESVGVLAMPDGYSAPENIATIGRKIIIARYGPPLLLILGVIAILALAGWRLVRR